MTLCGVESRQVGGRHMRELSSVVVSVIMAIVFLSDQASAQAGVAKKAIAKVEAALTKVANACSADMRTFCGAVTPGEGRLAFCLAAHEDKLSGKCYTAIMDVAIDLDIAASRLIRASDDCAPEINKLCGKVRDGQGRVAQCLIDNKAKLGPICRNEVASIEVRLKK